MRGSSRRWPQPSIVHAFVVANDAPLDILRHELPSAIRWVELRSESPAEAARSHGLSCRITDRGRRAVAPDEVLEDFYTPVMTRAFGCGPGGTLYRTRGMEQTAPFHPYWKRMSSIEMR
jgi:hypothetical protein